MRINETTTRQMQFGSLAKFQTVVDERLVRGRSVMCPYRLYKMKKEGINQIIDLRNTSFVERPIERFFCKCLGIKYKNFRYSARLEEIPEQDFFTRVNQSILENDGKTYIHCAYGKRRTGICVAMYEKFNSNKSDDEIIQNMNDMGFDGLKFHFSEKRANRYRTIYNNFIEKYFSDLVVQK